MTIAVDIGHGDTAAMIVMSGDPEFGGIVHDAVAERDAALRSLIAESKVVIDLVALRILQLLVRLHLLLHPSNVGLKLVFRKQITLRTLATGITDHSSSPADNGDRTMTRQLKATKRLERQEASDMKTVGCWVKTNINRTRLFVQPGLQSFIRRLVNQTTPFEIFVDIEFQ